MKVLITGSSGLIGKALDASLAAAGHSVTSLVRSAGTLRPGNVYWNPSAGDLDSLALEGLDAVVHLAGAPISQRWTAKAKAVILASRVQGTRLLAEKFALLSQRPKVFVSASAIGYYGDRGAELLTESSASGSGFVAEVCREWESAAEATQVLGIRTVRLRTGIVLSRKGGALAKMLPPFQMGVGGMLGAGTQYMSWISLEDLLGIILHAIAQPELQGAVNAVGPAPVTNLEFTKTLGKVLRRPTIFPVPAFAVGLVFGEMGRELLLGSTRVEPEKLKAAGYQFRHPTLEAALRAALT